jgi:hypothetical protein
MNYTQEQIGALRVVDVIQVVDTPTEYNTIRVNFYVPLTKFNESLITETMKNLDCGVNRYKAFGDPKNNLQCVLYWIQAD